MSTQRRADLQRFIDAVGAAFEASAPASGPALRTWQTASDRMQRIGPLPSPVYSARRLPVCQHLGSALATAGATKSELAAVATAFLALEPVLQWRPRRGAALDDPASPANAMVVGPDGLEPRDDVWLGVSLMAPDTLYPDHHHPPEEAYLALSPGEWRQQAGPWHSPGIGGTVHNPPGIVHTMRAVASAPLIAVWALVADPTAPAA